MSQTKLSILLGQLSKAESAQLDRYLLENTILHQLFSLLILPGEIDKVEIWKALYGKRPYDDLALRRHYSELLSLTLEFLAWRQLKKQPLLEVVYQLEALQKPALAKHFAGVVRQAESLLPRLPLRHAGFHLQVFHLEQARHHNAELRQPQLPELKHLEQADYHLDCFYTIQKLKHYCDALGYQKTRSRPVQIELPGGFFENIPASPYFREPAVQAFFLTASMLLHPEEEEHFRALRDLLGLFAQILPLDEQKLLFIHLMNYCIDTKINAGRTDYFAELFQLYQVALETEILFDDETLDAQHYKNIITVGLHERAFDWTEQFIQRYTPRLPREDRENALTYNLAKVYFQKQQYDLVIRQLREVEYQNLAYALGAKLLLLKTYYELGEFLALDSLSESFRIYLRRNTTISREVKQQYMQVLKYVRKLSQLNPGDKEAIARMRQQVMEGATPADKQWILEKLRDLET